MSDQEVKQVQSVQTPLADAVAKVIEAAKSNQAADPLTAAAAKQAQAKRIIQGAQSVESSKAAKTHKTVRATSKTPQPKIVTLQKGQTMQLNGASFNFSDQNWALWKPLSATTNGKPDNDIAGFLCQLFTLRADSAKAVEVATLVLGTKPKLTNKFTYRVGKADGSILQKAVTGAQVKARCQAILSIPATNVDYEVVKVGTGSKDKKPGTVTSKTTKLASFS
jgi:hypothetical protein